MRPVRLHLRSFMSYADEEIAFDRGDQVAIVGANGAGKSTIFEAIVYALYGQCERGSADELVRDGDTDMRVELDFEMAGVRYRIARDRQLGKASAASFLAYGGHAVAGPVAADPWARMTGRTIADTNAAILKIVGVPYDTFLASNMILQGRGDEFARLTPANRKRVLYDVLGLERYVELEARAIARAVEAEGLAADLRARAAAAAETADELPAAEDALAQAAARAEAARGRFTVAAHAAEAARDRLRAAQEALTALAVLRAGLQGAERRAADTFKARAAAAAEVERIEALLADEPRIRAAADEARTVEAALVGLSDRAGRAAAELRDREASRAELRARLQAVDFELQAADRAEAEAADSERHLRADPTICATCPFVADERAKAARLPAARAAAAAKRDRLLEVDRELAAARVAEGAARSAARDIEAEHGRAAGRLRGLAPTAALLPRIEVTRDRLDGALSVRQEAVQADDDAAAEVRRLQREVHDASGAAIEQERAAAAAGAADRELRDAVAERAAAEADLPARERAVDVARAAVARAAELEASADAAAREASAWRYVQAACGRDGIPAMIIENAVPAIEEIANGVLGHLPGGMTVRLSLRRMLKSSDRLADTLDIEVSGDGAGRRYELLSGGEKERVNLALRIGTSRVAASRYGSQIRFLAVDEAFGGQDADGLDRTLEVLAAAREHFDLVLVVSHLRGVAERYPARILITKDDAGSHAVAA